MSPGPAPATCATVPDGCATLYTDCSMRAVLDRIGDKWTVLVVGLLEDGPVRFNRIKAALPGISQKVLTSTLRSLERDGLVLREATLEVPVKVEYSLTPLGRSLSTPLAALRDWSAAHYCSVLRAREAFDAQQAVAG
jgi:DNA-binding HxlR family transcriptional regulator